LHFIFHEAKPERALLRLDELGVLRQIQRDLRADDWIARRLAELQTGLGNTPWARTQPTDIHYMGLLTFRLSEKALDEIIARLRIRAEDASTLHQVQTLKLHLPELRQPRRPSQIQRLLAPFAGETLLVGWLACEDETARAQLAQFQRELRDVEPIIDGHYLRREFNLRPGPIYRRILDHLRAARLDGEVITLADEQALVERWLADHRSRESGIRKSGNQGIRNQGNSDQGIR
jgi:tRNA nucleotidyltransferase (CCA-adding enzyme)